MDAYLVFRKLSLSSLFFSSVISQDFHGNFFLLVLAWFLLGFFLACFSGVNMASPCFPR
jgi:hypothetical protein